MRSAPFYNFLLEASLCGGLMILLMLPVRLLLRKRLGSRAVYFAWLLVALRPLHCVWFVRERWSPSRRMD